MMNFNKETFKSLEFLLLVITNVAAWLAQSTGTLSTHWAVYATAGSAGLYALARGLAKVNADAKSYWNTTEFWVAVLASIPAIITAEQSIISPHVYVMVQSVIAGLLAIASGYRKIPTVQAGPPTP